MGMRTLASAAASAAVLAGPAPAPAATVSLDRAICGRGRDVIGQFQNSAPPLDEWKPPDASDVVGLDCELVPFESSRFGGTLPYDGVRSVPGGLPGIDPRPVRRGRRAWIMRNPCATATRPCSARIELARPGHGSFARVSATGGTPRVTIRLGPIAARRLVRATRVAVTSRVRHRSRLEEIAFVLALR